MYLSAFYMVLTLICNFGILAGIRASDPGRADLIARLRSETADPTSLLDELFTRAYERNAVAEWLQSELIPSSFSEVTGCKPCKERCRPTTVPTVNPVDAMEALGLRKVSPFSSLLEVGCPPCVVPVAVACVAVGGTVTVGGSMTLAIGASIAAVVLGGGAAAGIGGVTALLGGALAGGMMGMFMGKTGLFHSHKNRRREHDIQMPCESWDPLDTLDHDCFVLRFNRMAWYFGAHSNLHRMEHAMVRGEVELETMVQKVGTDLDKLDKAIFGSAGTWFKPASAYGLISDTRNLARIMDFLDDKNANISLMSVANQKWIEGMAEDDPKDVLGHFVFALGNLTTDAENILDYQQHSSDLDNWEMMDQSSFLLSNAVRDSIASQRGTAEQLTRSNVLRRNAIQDAIHKEREERMMLDVVDNRADQTKQQIEKRQDVLADSLEMEVASTVSRISDVASSTNFHIKDKMDDIVFRVGDSSKAELIKDRSLWNNMTKDALDRMFGRFLFTADFVNAQSLKIQDLIFGLSVSNVTDSIHTQDLTLVNRTRQHEAALNSLAQLAKWMIDNSRPSDVLEKKSGFESDLDAQLVAIKQLLGNQIQQGGRMSKDGVAAVVAAIASASSDSKSVLKMGQSDYVSKISGIMNLLGVNSFDASGLFQKISSVVSTGTATSSDAAARIPQGQSGVASVLLDALTQIQADANSAQGSTNLQFQELENLLANSSRTSINMVNGTLGGLMSRGTTVSGLRSNALSENWFVVNRTAGLKSTGNQLMQSMFGLGSSSDSLAILLSLYELSNGGSLESLISSLGAADDSAATQLANQVNMSAHSNSSLIAPVMSRLTSLGNSVSKQVSQFEKLLDQRSLDSSGDETRTLSSTKTLLGLLEQLSAQSDSTSGKMFASKNSLRNDVQNGLKAILNQGGNTLIKYQSQYGPEMYQGTLESLSAYVLALQEQRRLELEHNKSDATALGSALSAIGRLVSSVRSDLSGIEAESGISASRFRDVETFNQQVAHLFTYSSSTLSELSMRLEAIRRTVDDGLANVSTAVTGELQRLPLDLDEGVSALVREEIETASDLRTKTDRIRVDMNSNRSRSEQAMDVAALKVIHRMENIQKKLESIDDSVRGDISQFTAISASERLQMERVIHAFEVAMLNLTQHVTNETEAGRIVEFQTSLDRLEALVEPVMWNVVNEVKSYSDEESLRDAVDWSKRNFHYQNDLINSERVVKESTNESHHHAQTTGNESDIVGRLLEEILSQGEADGATGISDRIESVLHQVSTAGVILRNNISANSGDVFLQQSVIISAMRQLVSLFREVVTATRDRQSRLVERDSEFVNRTELELTRSLGEEIREVGGSLSDSETVEKVIQTLSESEDDFEDEMDNDLAELKESVETFNQRRNTLFVTSGELLGELVDTNSLILNSMSNEIEHILDPLH